jgi:hypothetical protein
MVQENFTFTSPADELSSSFVIQFLLLNGYECPKEGKMSKAAFLDVFLFMSTTPFHVGHKITSVVDKQSLEQRYH